MEKISGIIPSNARVKSVDLSEAPPARPGAPAMGRKEGRNTVRDRVTMSEKAREMAAAAFKETTGGSNPKQAKESKIVEDINRKFFENRVKPVETPLSEEVTHAVTLPDSYSQYEMEVKEPAPRKSQIE